MGAPERAPIMTEEEFRLLRDQIHRHCGIWFRDDLAYLGEWVFRFGLTSSDQVRTLIGYAVDTLGHRRFAILYPRDDYGTDFKNRFWDEVERYRQVMTASGEFDEKRKRQAIDWMWTLVESGLQQRFRQHPRVRHDLAAVRRAVLDGKMTPAAAATRLLGHLETS